MFFDEGKNHPVPWSKKITTIDRGEKIKEDLELPGCRL